MIKKLLSAMGLTAKTETPAEVVLPQPVMPTLQQVTDNSELLKQVYQNACLKAEIINDLGNGIVYEHTAINSLRSTEGNLHAQMVQTFPGSEIYALSYYAAVVHGSDMNFDALTAYAHNVTPRQ